MKEQSGLMEEVCPLHDFRVNLLKFSQYMHTSFCDLFFSFSFVQLCTVRRCLQKTAPILLQLNERAAAASKERDEHKRARDQAVKEREQVRCSLLSLKQHCVVLSPSNYKVSNSFHSYLTCDY